MLEKEKLVLNFDPINNTKEEFQYYIVQRSKYSKFLELYSKFKDIKFYSINDLNGAKVYKNYLTHIKNTPARIIKRTVTTEIVDVE